MIFSVCPNPCLDVSYRVGALVEDDTNRVDSFTLSPGGKGVNAARVIAKFCDDSYLIAPLGGCIGKCVKNMLEEEGVTSIFIETESETRVNTILHQNEKKKHILIAVKGNRLQPKEIEKLHLAICKDLSPLYLILGGSIPEGLPPNFYKSVIESYRGTETKIIVDADGEILHRAVEAAPFAIKPNKYELERLVGSPLLTVKEIVAAAKEVLSKGVQVVIVSMGEYGVICVTQERTFRAIPPKVEVKSTVGAGDSLVGGFVFSLFSGKTLEEAVKFGVACGTATVMEEGTGLCSPNRVYELIDKITVRQDL